MPVTRAGQGIPVTSAGGAAGLPFKTDALFTPNAGALQAFRAAASSRAIVAANAPLGLVITPKTSLREAIARVSGTKATALGRRILLSEGTWDFPVDGITIDREGVEIVALSPGSTFFKQNARGSSPILTITGARVRVQGVTFETNTALQFAIDVQAQNVIIDDCRFTLGRGIAASGTTSGLCVRHNEFTSTASPTVLTVLGTCQDALIVGNRMRNADAAFDLQTCERAVVVANSFAPTGSILVTPGLACVVVGNTVGVNAASYTLADNTIAGTVSSDLRWPVASVFGVNIDFALYRGATPDVCQGRLDLAINSTDCTVYMNAVTTTVSPGVTFMGIVSGGYAYLQYTTTPTGSAATLKLGPPKERYY